MRVNSLLLFVLVIGTFASRLFAVEYLQFTFGGTFTTTTGSTHQVGDRFTTTLIFEPNPYVSEPGSLYHSFPTVEWSAPSNNDTPLVFGVHRPLALLQTNRGGAGGADTWRVRNGSSIFYSYWLTIDFPINTLPADMPPASLDLTQALSASFWGFDSGWGSNLNGTIDSLTVQTVPEPTAAAMLACVALAGRWRRAGRRT